MKQEIERLQIENAAWRQQHFQIKQERDSLVQEKIAIEHLFSNSKIEIATCTEKLSGLAQQLHEKDARNEELQRQNRQAQANLEHYRNASLEQRLAEQQRYEQQQKQFECTISQLNQNLSTLQQEKMQLKDQKQQLNFDNSSLAMQLTQLNAKYDTLKNELADIHNQLAKATQGEEHWKTQFNALQNKAERQLTELLEIKTEHAMLQHNLKLLS